MYADKDLMERWNLIDVLNYMHYFEKLLINIEHQLDSDFLGLGKACPEV